MALRVALISDDPLLSERLRQAARREPELALSIAPDLPPRGELDAVVVPAGRLGDGEDLQGLRSRGAWVIGYGRPEHLRAAFLAGCDDYLKEPWSAVELVCRLERLRARGVALASAGTSGPAGCPAAPGHAFAWGVLRLEGLCVCSPSQRRPLSLPEYRILAALLRHRGQAVPRTVLYYAIWGKAPAGPSRVVDVHVSSVRRKLLALFPDSRGCLRCLRGSGYALG